MPAKIDEKPTPKGKIAIKSLREYLSAKSEARGAAAPKSTSPIVP